VSHPLLKENTPSEETCQDPVPGIVAGEELLPVELGAGSSSLLDTCDQVGIFHKTLVRALELCGRGGEAYSVAGCCQDFRVGKCQSCGAAPAYPLTCSHRLCPSCAARRGARLVAEHQDLLRQLHYPKMLTLTFLSVKELDRHFIRWARGCFTKLRHRKVFESCWGGIYSFETTWSAEFGWHLHIHALIGSGYIDQANLSKAWQKISGAVVVDIRSVKGKDKWGAVREVVKYPTKAATYLGNAALVDEFLKATQGVNLAYGFGAMYRVKTRAHARDKMRCPLCGNQGISFKGGYGFYVPRVAVLRVKGGWLWRPPPGGPPPVLSNLDKGVGDEGWGI
jgi:Replication protein.